MATPKFITENDFVGKISLATNSLDEEFEDFSAQSEEDLLLCLLNAKLYNELIADLDGNNDPQTQKFIDLVDGVTYVDSDTQETINYLGLRDLIRYYVFSVWREEQYTRNSEVGQIRENTENATQTSRTQLKIAIKKRWNEFVVKYNSTVCFIFNNYETYFPVNNDFSYWTPKRFFTKGSIKTGQQSWIDPRKHSNYNKCSCK